MNNINSVALTEADREAVLRAHVHISPADLLAAVERIVAAARADAWDEGFDACFDVTGEPFKQDVPNPYRARIAREGGTNE